ncbi:hypothetical protein STENM223S_02108 [Streptomyces tendae]
MAVSITPPFVNRWFPPTTDWRSKFDYVFLRGIAPAEHRVVRTRHSDHDMLYADLDVT